MSRFIVLLLSGLMVALLPSFALAQQADPDPTAAPDYRVNIFNYEYAEADGEIIINYGVYNKGGPALEPSIVEIFELDDPNTPIQVDELPPLRASGDSIDNARLRLPVARFEPGSQQVLRILVTVPGEDPLTMLDNELTISITIPDYDPATLPQQTAPDSDTGGFEIPLLGIVRLPNFDFSDDQAVTIGVVSIVVLSLLITILLLRILLRRPPAFGNWQPPYATMPPLDPHSTYGIRQAWQPHAQNNVVPTPCYTGTVHARKVLLGMDGDYLSGWRVGAVRMTQYDMYGRVARSQVLAPAGKVRRLARLARKAHKMDADKLARSVRPVARNLARQFRKKLNPRNAMLPIALDVRLLGTHGEVRIVFELHECRSGQPVKLDSWEPEMTVLGKTIYESYTFTIFGQAGGEGLKDFRKRLPDDIERVLVDMLRTGTATTERRSPPPDTLSGTQPVQSGDPAPATETGEAVAPAPGDHEADTQH